MKPFRLVTRIAQPLFGVLVLMLVGVKDTPAVETATAEESSGFSLPPLTAVDVSKRDEWERLGEESDRVLADRSFVEHWRARADFCTPTGARQALAEADDQLKKIDEAVQKKSGACLYTFFVNHCIDEARKTSFVRKREIRSLMTDARAVIHAEEVKEHEKARLAREAKEPNTPIKIEPKKVDTTPKEPVRIAPKEVRAPSLPKSRTPKAPEEASLPNVPKGAQIDSSETNADHDAMREALEKANLAAQALREEERKLRQQKAEEKAKARKAKREAKRRQFEETMAQRIDAQRRLEKEREDGKQSNLFGYF